MRKETICISERNLMFVVAGQLYDQAPDRQPRKVEEIMKGVRFHFRNDARCDNNNECTLSAWRRIRPMSL